MAREEVEEVGRTVMMMMMMAMAMALAAEMKKRATTIYENVFGLMMWPKVVVARFAGTEVNF